jgi:hypothetical protein
MKTSSLKITAALTLAVAALPLGGVFAHEGHNHGPDAHKHAPTISGDPWTSAQASLKAIQAATVAKQQAPIHDEQEKLVVALKQLQEKGGAADKARFEGAIKNAIAASEKVHVAADANDFAKVESNLKTLEATMAMVEKQLGGTAK